MNIVISLQLLFERSVNVMSKKEFRKWYEENVGGTEKEFKKTWLGIKVRGMEGLTIEEMESVMLFADERGIKI